MSFHTLRTVAAASAAAAATLGSNNDNDVDIDGDGQRELTFLNEGDDEYVNDTLGDTGLIVGFSILAVAFVWTAMMNVRVTSGCREFYEWNAIRLIMPGINWAMAMECVTLAVDVKTKVASQWAIAIYMLEATIAPGIFLSSFVITFLAYRNRSLPFCLVHRGPGRGAGNSMTDEDDEAVQPLVRPATMVVMVRLFGLFLFSLTLVVNFDVVWNSPDLAGRAGWTTVFREPWDLTTSHIALALTPMALVSGVCLYFSLLLWRYGSFFSMKIYPSVWNPWIFAVVGTGFLMAGQCFGPDLFPILSNAGILLYQMCVLRIMYEVRHDIKHTSDLGGFLDALGDDQVTGTVAAMEVDTTTTTTKGGGTSHHLPSIQ